MSRAPGAAKQTALVAAALLAALWGCGGQPAGRPPDDPPPTSARTARPSLTDDALPTPRLSGITREQRQVSFESGGVELAGELDLPVGAGPTPLAVIIHHSGPVPRDSYGYLAELLLQRGYAVFRFDKRGTGMSGGEYGCCESEDALAAYRAAVRQEGVDRCNIFILAQSIGTEHLAERYRDYAQSTAPRGVVLLSNRLRADRIGAIEAPTLIIVSDSEPDLAAIGAEAAQARRASQLSDTSLYVAEGTEHTLFDTSDGPIDWSDPGWVERYHRGAMQTLLDWLDAHRQAPDACLRPA